MRSIASSRLSAKENINIRKRLHNIRTEIGFHPYWNWVPSVLEPDFTRIETEFHPYYERSMGQLRTFIEEYQSYHPRMYEPIL